LNMRARHENCKACSAEVQAPFLVLLSYYTFHQKV
jgi:hypothetical protein